MKARSDTERILDAYLAPEADQLADRVIEAALADIARTPQRRSWWPAWRISPMNKLALAAAAAVAILVLAVVGYNLLPKQGGVGGPNATPSPTPAPLAVGDFTSHGVAAQLDARGAGDSVTGTLTVADSGLTATVDLECSRTADGLLFIGGLVRDSSFDDNFPEGRRVAIILEPGSPIKALWYIALLAEPPVDTCRELVEDIIKPAEARVGLEPIEGTIELAP